MFSAFCDANENVVFKLWSRFLAEKDHFYKYISRPEFSFFYSVCKCKLCQARIQTENIIKSHVNMNLTNFFPSAHDW